MCVFLWSHVCLRSCLNKAIEIIIFSHLLGTNIAIFTEKPKTVNDDRPFTKKPKTVNDDRAFHTSFLYPKFLPTAVINLFNVCPCLKHCHLKFGSFPKNFLPAFGSGIQVQLLSLKHSLKITAKKPKLPPPQKKTKTKLPQKKSKLPQKPNFILK